MQKKSNDERRQMLSLVFIIIGICSGVTMTINSMDATAIAKLTADSFKTRVSHLRQEITQEEYDKVYETCIGILGSKVDNSLILNNQYDPSKDEVLDGSK